MPEAKPVKPFTSPWTFHLEFVDGKNLITAKVGKTVQFRVVCDKLEVVSPTSFGPRARNTAATGNIQASGSVKITSQTLEATCDRLTIQLHDEAVRLEGSAHMKCQHDGQELDLRADSFSLKLSDIHGKAAPAVGTIYYQSPGASPQDPNLISAPRPPVVSEDPGRPQTK